MARRFDFEKQQLWLGRVRAWERSKRTVRDFCSRHRLSEPSFYAWKRVLAERGLLAPSAVATQGASQAATQASKTNRGGGKTAPLFVVAAVSDVDRDAETAVRPLEVVLPDGIAVRVGAGFDAATLRRLLALLRGQSC